MSFRAPGMESKTLQQFFNEAGEEGLRGKAGELGCAEYAAYILDQLKPANGSRLLDLGCGDGRVLRTISRWRPDLKCLGLDFAEAQIVKAVEESIQCPNLEFRVADLKSPVPFAWLADLAFSFSVIQYFTPREFVEMNLGIAKSLLKPGGAIHHLSIPDIAKRPLLFHATWLDAGSQNPWAAFLHFLRMSAVDCKRRFTGDRAYGNALFHDPCELESLSSHHFQAKIQCPSDSWYRFDIRLQSSPKQ